MEYFGRWIRCRLLPALFICAGAMAMAAPETKVEMSVQLPPFIVESTIGPTWRYTEIPRFEILSRCNDLTTERLALAFHRANQLLGLVLPERFQLALDVPQTLIFYDEKLWPVAEQQAVAALLQANPPARPTDSPAAGRPPRAQLEPIIDGALANRETTTRAAAPNAFFSSLTLTDADSISLFALVSDATIDPQASYLTSAYVGNLLHSRVPALPEWLTAGFMRLYDRMSFRNNTVAVKPLRWDVVADGGHRPLVQRASDGRGEFFDILRAANREDNPRGKTRRELELGKQSLPLPQQEAEHIRRDSAANQKEPAPDPNPQEPAPDPKLRLPLAGLIDGATPAVDLATWLAQVELFVSWGIDPANGRAAAFWDLVDRACTEPVTETLFQECLGLDFATATHEILAYSINHRGIRWVLPEDLAQPPPSAFQDASPLQIARIKGEWERLEARYVRKNQPDLEEHYVTLARRSLRKPYDRGDRDPRLLASLGLLELDAGDQPAAKAFLEEAVAGGVVRPRAYYALARLRYDYLFGRSTRNDGKFTADQTDPILQPLLVAARQAPPLAAVYELMAHVSAQNVEPPSAEVLEALAQGVRYFPRDSALLRQLATLQAGGGEPPRSNELVPELSGRSGGGSSNGFNLPQRICRAESCSNRVLSIWANRLSIVTLANTASRCMMNARTT